MLVQRRLLTAAVNATTPEKKKRIPLDVGIRFDRNLQTGEFFRSSIYSLQALREKLLHAILPATHVDRIRERKNWRSEQF